MTTVLVAGANGQVGQELRRSPWAAGVELVAHPSTTLDITDPSAVAGAVEAAGPDVIVNAAAYTEVDRAEDEPDRAVAVNRDGVAHLAAAADRAGALLVHLSSDYVFDGAKTGRYTEADPVSPLGVYGRSKAAGEEAALAATRSITLRTSWVYGAKGPNFVATMLRLALERDELGVVDDQYGCPTSAADLALAIGTVIERMTEPTTSRSLARLYHLAAPDDASWYELALATFEASALGFGGTCRRLTTAQYPTRAPRPANSRLDSGAIARDLGIELPSWRCSLPAVVAEIEEGPRD